MKKKLLIFLVAVVSAVGIMLGLSACDIASCNIFSSCDPEQGAGQIEHGPDEHDYGEWVVVTPATCLEEGLERRECECGEYETRVIAALGHTFGDWKVTAEPTCTSMGVEIRECVCGEQEKRYISALGHDYVPHAAQEATCTESGWNAYLTCSRCDYTTYKESPATGHTYSEEWSHDEEAHWRAAECGHDVTSDYALHDMVGGVCSVCGYSESGEPSADAPTEGLEYDLSSDRTYYIVSGIGTATDTEIVVPSVYESKPVQEIAESAFEGQEHIISIIIPDSVIKIGDKAFAGCTALIQIILPDEVEIGTDVFRGTINVIITFRHFLEFVSEVVPTCGNTGNIAHYVCKYCGNCYADADGKERLYNVEYTVDHEFAGGVCINCGAVDSQIKIVEIDDSVQFLGKFALGTLENAIGLPESIIVITEDGREHSLSVEWDLSDYKKNEVGIYVIRGYLTLGDYILDDGLSAVIEVTIEIVDYMYGTADIVFVIDTTGSMSGDINSVKNNINNFANALEEAGVSARWGLVTYEDITCDGIDSTKIVYNGSSEWFANADEYKAAISDISLGYGGDDPETAIDGLMAATTLTTRKDVRTFFILVTDAMPKNNNTYGVSDMNEMADILAENDIYTSVVAPSGYQSSYRVLAESTGGVVTSMNNFSDVLLEELTPLIFEKVTD